MCKIMTDQAALIKKIGGGGESIGHLHLHPTTAISILLITDIHIWYICVGILIIYVIMYDMLLIY